MSREKNQPGSSGPHLSSQHLVGRQRQVDLCELKAELVQELVLGQAPKLQRKTNKQRLKRYIYLFMEVAVGTGSSEDTCGLSSLVTLALAGNTFICSAIITSLFFFLFIFIFLFFETVFLHSFWFLSWN